MNFIAWLFNTKKAVCPRCLGKGHVDLHDIKRLKKEMYWSPGKCAYCNGKGKVPSKLASTEIVDLAYLTTDISKEERSRILNGDEGALQRAGQHQAEIDEVVRQIEHLYYIENLESGEIAQYFLRKYGRSKCSSEEMQETIEYIEDVIKSKLSNG